MRRRLTPEQSRSAALDAARDLLIEAGPQAVTLKAVASRIGRTHANLLHHFGSAADLQMALAEMLARQVCAKIGEIAVKARRGEADPRIIVDMTFDVFDQQGAGALATWMIMTGNESALNPVVDTIRALIDELDAGDNARLLGEDTLGLVLMAMGDALLGAALARALDVPRETAREIAYKRLITSPGVAARLGLA